MAPKPKAGGGNVLTRKLGPAPAWVWLVIGVAGFYLYRHYQSASQSGGTATAALTPSSVDTSGTTSGLGTTIAPASGGGTPVDNTSADLLSQLIGNEQQINTNLSTALISAQSNLVGLGYSGNGSSGATSPGTTVGIEGTPVAHTAVSAQTSTHSQPFGGIVSVSTTKSGAKITTYATGRQVEQAPGKTAYVIKK